MFETSMLAAPRDLVDFGIDQALDQIQDAGATSVSLNLVAPPTAYLRSTPGSKLAIIRDDGGFHFPTDGEAFRSLTLNPRGSSHGRTSLADIASRCRQRGLGVQGRITATHLPRLASRYTHVAARNILGDIAPARICPAHLDLQHLLKATLLDLRQRLTPDVIELADLAIAATPQDFELGCDALDCATDLLAICFCDACRQRSAGAGVDVSSVETWVRDMLARALAEPAVADPPLAERMADTPDVRAYLDVQQSCLDAVVADLASLGVPLAFVLDAVQPDLTVTPRSLGPSPRLILPAPAEDAHACAALLRDRFGPDLPISLEIPARDAHHAPQELVHRVKQAAEARFSGVGIDHFGTLTAVGMTAVRQGFRFARRQT